LQYNNYGLWPAKAIGFGAVSSSHLYPLDILVHAADTFTLCDLEQDETLITPP